MKTIFKNVCIGIILLTLSATTTSCYQKFYKVADNFGSQKADSNALKLTGKYVILRSGDSAFSMNTIVFNSDSQLVTCDLDTIEKVHLAYVSAKPDKELIYRKSKGEEVVLNEVHIFIPYDAGVTCGKTYTLDLKKVAKIEVIEKDKAATSRSTAFSTIGIVLGTGLFLFGVLGIAIAASGGIGF